jgi:hypothetical protein
MYHCSYICYEKPRSCPCKEGKSCSVQSASHTIGNVITIGNENERETPLVIARDCVRYSDCVAIYNTAVRENSEALVALMNPPYVDYSLNERAAWMAGVKQISVASERASLGWMPGSWVYEPIVI